MVVRTRFAPSPTGFLHIGGARTALYAWLFARHHNGQFILRIEDTDRERSTEASVQAIIEGMAWLQLDYDEGPFFQMQRLSRYEEVIAGLLSAGKAYRCYCSKERLETLRATQLEKKEKPRYDGHCRHLNLPHKAESYVVRFANPLEGEVAYQDQVYGQISFRNDELDDLVIAKGDGIPTYNFAVVVDDFDMKITHVIRGDDHINNTPRQINIFNALGAKAPIYAHLPMILGSDGKRLSKRHGAVSVLQYREDGFLPQALLNYLLRLGWSHGDQEIFSREEMIALFSFQAINKGSAAFNPDKLLWLNQWYLKNLPAAQVVEHFKWQLHKMNVHPNSQSVALPQLIKAQADRSKTLVEMAEKSRFFFEETVMYDEQAAKANFSSEIVPALQTVKSRWQDLPQWEEPLIEQVINETLEYFDLKLPKLAIPLRVALTGNTTSPPITQTIYLLGREKTVARLEHAIRYINETNLIRKNEESH